MSRVNRLVYALAVFATALFPLSVAAAPSPSPSIEQTLAAPPSGYTQIHTGTLDGHFDPHSLAATYSAGAAEAENTVIHDGFVDGYAMTWHQQSPPRDLIEYVVAFRGGRGASSWLSYDEAIAKSDPKFEHSESIAGIEPSYGAHLSDPSSGAVADVFSFVKGNDVYGVALISTGGDVLNLAMSQTRSQYGYAPSETIPRAQWPENVSASPDAELFGGLAGQAVAVIAVVGVALVVVGYALRARTAS